MTGLFQNHSPQRGLFLSAILLGATMLLSACGSDQAEPDPDPEPDPQSGTPGAVTRILYDAPVDGVRYQCDGTTGTTANGGEFDCVSAPVSFSVGDLPIGEITEFNADNFVYLQDLFRVSREAVDDVQVVKLARLLLSLDDDGDVSQAITIPAERANRFGAADSLDDALENLAATAGVELVSTPFAIAHLRRSLLGGADSSEFTIFIKVDDSSPESPFVLNDVNLKLKGAELYSDAQASVRELTMDQPIKTAVLHLKNPPEANQDIKILARAEGYVDTGAALLLSQQQKVYQLELKMVKDQQGEIAEGIHAGRQDLTGRVDANGEVLQAIELQSKAAQHRPGVTVRIPEGVQMSDADGNPLQGATLRVVGFDPYESAALAAYPGGLNVMAEADGFSIDGEIQNGEREINFKSAGFAAIQIEDAAGNKVKNFSADIEVAMQFNIGTMDGAGNVVQIGDEVPIWSYDEDSGKWSYEKVGITQDLDTTDGLYDVVYSINHLTYFNLDWHYGAKCTTPRFVFSDTSGVFLPSLEELSFRLVINASPSGIDRWFNGYADDTAFLRFFNTPGGFPGSLRVYDIGRENILGIINFTDLCAYPAEQDINVELDVDPSDTYQQAKAKLAVLRDATDKKSVQAVRSARYTLNSIFALAAQFIAMGDERGDELFDETVAVSHSYSEAFLNDASNIFQQRLTALGFIDTVQGGFGGYGCMQDDLAVYLRTLVEVYANYQTLAGPKEYDFHGLILPFYEEAAKDFIRFEPDQLAYSAQGVSEFVRCGQALVGNLLAFGYEAQAGEDILDLEIQEHFEPVIRLNVANMRQDVEAELNGTGGILDDLPPPPAGTISFSTAATFDFIIEDALSSAQYLQVAGLFSAAGMAELESARAFLQELRDAGKVEDEQFVPN